MTNKVAVITGGTGGLGREIVRVFYGNAYRVAANYHASLPEPIGGTDGETEKQAMTIRADVRRFDEVSKMASAIYQRWGRVDVLVNNAGVTKDSLLVKQREEDWDHVIAVNLKGAFNTIRAFAPLMAEGGHIVNISSYSGLKGKEGQAAYSAAKAALLGLTKSAAAELAEHSIRVNALLPGYMFTRMGADAGAALARAREESLLHTLSDPREVANFIVFLASTAHITGQIFCLDSRIL